MKKGNRSKENITGNLGRLRAIANIPKEKCNSLDPTFSLFI